MTAMPEPEPAPANAASSRSPAPGASGGTGGGVEVDLLDCGRPVSALVDQVDTGQLEPTDAHQAGCPHCRSALRGAAVSGQALDLLRSTRGPTPAGLADRVVREVRSRRTTGTLIDLEPSARARGGRLQVAGGVRVDQQVVADLARVAAATVRGVTVAQASAAGQPGLPGGIQVTLGLLVDGRTPLPELARLVRRTVRAALRRATGGGQVEVTLTALDMLDPQ